MKQLFLILLILTVLSCTSTRSDKKVEICSMSGFSQKIEPVSFDDEERIKHLHGNYIEIAGVFRRSFEHSALYPSEKYESEKALWVELTLPEDVPDSVVNTFVDKRVSIVGRVDTTRHGHLGAYLAVLSNAFCIKKR